MPVLLLALAAALAGHAASGWLWSREPAREPPGPIERLVSSALLGLAFAVASAWFLSSCRLLAAGPIVAVHLGLAFAGLAANLGAWRELPLQRRARLHGRPLSLPRIALAVALASPPILWTIFALWRGWLLPPIDADGLAYHLPKAALVVRHHGYAWFGAAGDLRIATTPFDYELLLAEVLALDGGRTTEWVATLGWMLFALASAALSERWWRSTAGAVASALLVAGMPVALLQAPIHSNDLLLAFAAICALLWSGRWVAEGGVASLALAVVATMLAIGTKVSGLAIAAGVVVALGWGLVRRPLPRAGARTGALALAAAALGVALLGGVPYVGNWLHRGHWLGSLGWGDGAPFAGDHDAILLYGEWSNLWRVPWLLLGVPFSGRAGVWIPWRGERWPWPEFDARFSHLGVAVSLLVVVAPACVLQWGFRAARDRAWTERVATSVAAGVACILLAPVRLRPDGAFAQAPRLAAFAVAVLAAWTVAPIVARGSARGTRLGALAAVAPLLGLGATLLWYAVDFGRKDRLAPERHLAEFVRDLGPRLIARRAPEVLDLVAGEQDAVALDAGFDAWIYPAFGRRLTREVVFLPKEGEVRVPPHVRWVAVDRGWARAWGHPELVDFGRLDLRNRGPFRPEDARVLVALAADPDWEAVWIDVERNQAVFHRLSSVEREERPDRAPADVDGRSFELSTSAVP